ncbi:MAG: methyltransferase domain-containing protein [Alphaproteobacteria bacterium]|nr:methyltransferase domain-containing protein [Alphaproteobacteria bacterium]
MTAENQSWNVGLYNQNASFVSEYGQEVLEWLAPKSGERILDVGCGEGTLALIMSECKAHVVGIDASEDMVEAAKKKGVEAYVMDAAALSYKQAFDAVFSNATLHWVKPPEKAVEGIFNALKDGGRFVAEFGGKGNVETIQTALIESVSKRDKDGKELNPWYFPSPDEYKNLLEAQGFSVEKCELFIRPTPLKTGIEGWLRTFANPFLSSFSEQEAKDIITEVIVQVRPILWNQDMGWFADYVRLRVKAIKG